MKLYEWQAKELIKEFLQVPNSTRDVTKFKEFVEKYSNVVCKTQVLFGSRAKKGLIKFANKDNFKDVLDQLPNDTLIEEAANIQEEWYVSFDYNIKTKLPRVTIAKGGVDVEEQTHLIQADIDINNPKFPDVELPLKELYDCFWSRDATLLEINPLAKTDRGWMAIDAKMVIDDHAMHRQDDIPTSFTTKELAALIIDRSIKGGVGGKTYVELDGDIATLCSGGGASILTMDALIEADLKPANYTEVSGNPPREKVAELTRLVLNRDDLKGLIVCGGKANFTDIKEQCLGMADALIEIQPPYPIVVRRDGPHKDEGFKILEDLAKKINLDITLLDTTTTIPQAIKVLEEKCKQ